MVDSCSLCGEVLCLHCEHTNYTPQHDNLNPSGSSWWSMAEIAQTPCSLIPALRTFFSFVYLGSDLLKSWCFLMVSITRLRVHAGAGMLALDNIVLQCPWVGSCRVSTSLVPGEAHRQNEFMFLVLYPLVLCNLRTEQVQVLVRLSAEKGRLHSMETG